MTGVQTCALPISCWHHPDFTMINWLRGGEKLFDWRPNNAERYYPELKPWKHGKRLLVLCDYDEDGEKYAALARPHYEDIEIRKHPSNEGEAEGLIDALEKFDLAIGGKTTALVKAAIEGLPVFCTDKSSPVYPVSSTIKHPRRAGRIEWINSLSWHNWSKQEIKSGEAWQHIRSSLNQP